MRALDLSDETMYSMHSWAAVAAWRRYIIAVFTVFSILCAGVTPSTANHVEGPRPEPQPAPSPWLRTAWGLDDSSSPLSTLDGTGVRVAVLDGPLWEGDATISSLIEQRRIIARDFLPGDWGDNNHGTGVVSLVVDPRVGIAPGVTLVHARVCAESCPAEAVAAGLRYAVAQKARIIVASFGAVSDDRLVEETLRWVREKGVLVIAASGNHGCPTCTNADRIVLPASSPDVLTVGALASTPSGWVSADFTAASSAVDLAGPGVDLPVTLSGGLRRFSGTSATAPIVGGVAALLLQANPALTIDELAGALVRGAAVVSTPRSGLGGSSVRPSDIVGAGGVDPSASHSIVASQSGNLSASSPLRKNNRKPAQLPNVTSQKWTSEGLRITFASAVNGAISLADSTGAPVSSLSANGQTVLFPVPVYTDTVRWSSTWSVAANGGGVPRTLKVTPFALAVPKIRYLISTDKQTRIGWSAVPKATRYAVMIGGQRLVTSGTSISVNNLTLGYASRVQVLAMRGDTNSATLSAPSSLQFARPAAAAPGAPVVAMNGTSLEVTVSPGSVVEFVRSDGAWYEVSAPNGRAVLQNVLMLAQGPVTYRVRVSVRNGFSWRAGTWSQEVAVS